MAEEVHDKAREIGIVCSIKYPLSRKDLEQHEPGYYEDGELGIILENVLIVKEVDTNFNFGDRGYLSFEYITWVVVGRGVVEATLSVNLEFLATTLGSQERLAIAEFVDCVSIKFFSFPQFATEVAITILRIDDMIKLIKDESQNAD
ncbi:hypothetical protein JHK87_039682 [Glycine soja]|nr:hypothetical protein JHK87_039682 [Glycine soja]